MLRGNIALTCCMATCDSLIESVFLTSGASQTSFPSAVLVSALMWGASMACAIICEYSKQGFIFWQCFSCTSVVPRFLVVSTA